MYSTERNRLLRERPSPDVETHICRKLLDRRGRLSNTERTPCNLKRKIEWCEQTNPHSTNQYSRSILTAFLYVSVTLYSAYRRARDTLPQSSWSQHMLWSKGRPISRAMDTYSCGAFSSIGLIGLLQLTGRRSNYQLRRILRPRV